MEFVKSIDRKGDGPVVGVKARDTVYFPSEEKLENAIYAEGASPRSTGCRQGRELTSRADAEVSFVFFGSPRPLPRPIH